ncbi:hypothetical protein, partial [Fulvivirga kasyanovii]
CKPKENKEMLKENIVEFDTLVIKETTSGNGLFLWDIPNYQNMLKGDIAELDKATAEKILYNYSDQSQYFPLIALKYETPDILILFTLQNGISKGFIMSTFKGNKKVDELNLWELSGVNDFKELAEKMTLDHGVSKGEKYYFHVFSNNYYEGYYFVNVLLNGEIDVEKIELKEGDIP